MKNFIRFWFMGLLMPCLLLSCQREEAEEQLNYPRLRETIVSSVTESGATFQSAVVAPGQAEIIDHGFVWRKGNNKDLSVLRDVNANPQDLEKLSLGPLKGSTTFEGKATYGLSKNTTYVVRSYLTTKDGYTVYGHPAVVASLGSQLPAIAHLQPETAIWGDTITILGNNFSHMPATLEVTFNNSYQARIIRSTGKTIQCIVPDYLQAGESKVSVKTTAGRSANMGTFKLDTTTPILTSFSPTTATYGETITITGSNFIGDIRYWRVAFSGSSSYGWEDVQTSIELITPTEIKVKVPELSRRFYNIKLVRMSSGSNQIISKPSTQILTLPAPSIHSIGLEPGFSRSNVRIKGVGFSKPEVFFAGNVAPILQYTGTDIVIDPIHGVYPKPTSSVLLEVTSAEQKDSRQISFSYQAPWVKRANRQQGPILSANQIVAAFSIKNQGYVINRPVSGYGIPTQVFRYTPGTYEWQKLPDSPINLERDNLNGAGSFVIKDKAYILVNTMYSSKINLYRYDPIANSWQVSKAPDLNYPPYGSHTICTLGDKGYLFTGDQAGSIWEFDSEKEVWERRHSNLLPNGSYRFSGAFSLNNKVYTIVLASISIANIYSFDPGTNEWKLEANFNYNPSSDNNSFIASVNDGKVYLVNTREAFKYNPTTGQVELLAQNGLLPNHSSPTLYGFSYQKKTFIMTGNYDFWEVTPE